MTAPDRIYAWPSEDGRGWYAGGCSDEPSMCFDDVEYLRRAPEVLAADETVQALVAAAAKGADEFGYKCASCGHLCGDPEADLAIIKKAGGHSCCPERDLRPLSEDLTPADAATALSRLLAEAENRGRVAALEEAAREARGFDGFAEGAATWPTSIARRIEKLKGPTP